MKIYNYILASALLMSVAACSSDDDMLSPYEADPNAVRIQPQVSGIVVSRTAPQDANSTVFNSGDEICVGKFVGSSVVDFYPYTFNGANWSPTKKMTDFKPYLRWENGETELTLKAYYPKKVSKDQYVDINEDLPATMNDFKLPTIQNGVDKIAKADYMTFSGNVTKGNNNSVSFAMQRHTARVCVSINGFGDQYNSSNTQCDVKIYSPHEIIKVTYSDKITASGLGNSPILVTPYNGTGLKLTDETNNGGTAIALVTPSAQAMNGKTFIEVTVRVKVGEGETASENIKTLYVKGIPAFQGGYSYTYNLHVGKDVVNVESVTVKPWSEPIVVNGGIAKENTEDE